MPSPNKEQKKKLNYHFERLCERKGFDSEDEKLRAVFKLAYMLGHRVARTRKENEKRQMQRV